MIQSAYKGEEKVKKGKISQELIFEDVVEESILVEENAGFIHDKEEGNSETLLLACYGDINNVWYLDSGASKHMTGNKHLFSSLEEFERGQMTIGDAKSYKIQGMGEIIFKTKSKTLEKMSKVYYVLGLQCNLRSTGQL
ncbi:hypothetical protein FEM48_Zijuj12G0188600 [Ziziphus jujuba var. spinosa]|uniref:Retrovirus-related Pol polyprotein from transposon TNT 1-94-like beta-barrel domain-containing protein n=1 Tax=Ziziphus jujuba var. spinosa TaxID=714518 RepID=A0A978UEY6_ZIZJJ|nr:hypothetical protein FEM48_Zijuj12G0188600 [Ziziphus jujuba var. spinosa]